MIIACIPQFKKFYFNQVKRFFNVSFLKVQMHTELLLMKCRTSLEESSFVTFVKYVNERGDAKTVFLGTNGQMQKT